ncbi:MAG TPA: hypothetical protein VFB38_10155 [Chthonomonadaceae bacterium]|nr:hypothetical protein [Chthonomonadaceae bacterium]
MSQIAPKPIIAQVIRTWQVPPGLKFALVKDVEGRIWAVESCPVGTHFWTVAQVAELPRGARTRRVLEEVARVGQRLEQTREQQPPIPLPRSVRRDLLSKDASEPSAALYREERARRARPARLQRRAAPAAAKTLAGV